MWCLRVLGEKELTKCLTEAVKCVEEEGERMERCADVYYNHLHFIRIFSPHRSLILKAVPIPVLVTRP